MHIHNVYFWLDEGLDDSDRAAFEQGLDSLTKDPAARGGHYGPPADTHRDVVERSYSYGLVLIFENLAAHNAYQVGEVHQQFVDQHLPKWTKAVVHDIETR
jgi:hypothetical protein